jgi:hypothetical protein
VRRRSAMPTPSLTPAPHRVHFHRAFFALRQVSLGLDCFFLKNWFKCIWLFVAMGEEPAPGRGRARGMLALAAFGALLVAAGTCCDMPAPDRARGRRGMCPVSPRESGAPALPCRGQAGADGHRRFPVSK